MPFNHAEFYTAVRPFFGGRLTQAQVDILSPAIDRCLAVGINHSDAVTGAQPSGPSWLIEAMADLGLAEVPGARTAPRIQRMLSLLSYPFSDDETPWCGTAMAAWVKQSGLVPPAAGYRAANWMPWGVSCLPQVGAVGVKQRTGGNHVFMIVGITADRSRYKALGANQGNRVCVIDILVSDTKALRWPTGVPQTSIPLPVMPAGTLSSLEA